MTITNKDITIHKTSYKKEFEPNNTIKHLAIIMDGNRRWAQNNGLPAQYGHKKGAENVKLAVEFSVENNISHLSLYTFSLENFKRSQSELDEIFATIERGISDEEFQKIMDYGVRVVFIGQRSRFPTQLLKTIETIEEKTKNNKKLTLNLLFCYGGQQEITDAVATISRKVLKGEIEPDSINSTTIQQHLWTHKSPNPDLIVRTGGQQRLSNFLPWQSAYSELLFIEKYWPALTKDDLYTIIKEFEQRQRNFGK